MQSGHYSNSTYPLSFQQGTLRKPWRKIYIDQVMTNLMSVIEIQIFFYITWLMFIPVNCAHGSEKIACDLYLLLSGWCRDFFQRGDSVAQHYFSISWNHKLCLTLSLISKKKDSIPGTDRTQSEKMLGGVCLEWKVRIIIGPTIIALNYRLMKWGCLPKAILMNLPFWTEEDIANGPLPVWRQAK